MVAAGGNGVFINEKKRRPHVRGSNSPEKLHKNLDMTAGKQRHPSKGVKGGGKKRKFLYKEKKRKKNATFRRSGVLSEPCRGRGLRKVPTGGRGSIKRSGIVKSGNKILYSLGNFPNQKNT